MAGEAVMPTLSAAVLLLFVSACPSATAPAAAAKVPETSGVCPAVCAEQEAWKCQFAGLVRDEEPDELPICSIFSVGISVKSRKFAKIMHAESRNCHIS